MFMLLLFSGLEKNHCIFNPTMDPRDDLLIDELDDELESTLQQVDRRALDGIEPIATDAAQLTVVQPVVQVCPARLSSFLSCVVCRSTQKAAGLVSLARWLAGIDRQRKRDERTILPVCAVRVVPFC